MWHGGGTAVIKQRKPRETRQKRRDTTNRIGPVDENRAAHTLRVIRNYETGESVFRAGQDLFQPGAETSVVYILLNGWAFFYGLIKDGHRQIVHFAMPGGVLGFLQTPGTRTTFGVQALTDVTVSVIPQPSLSQLSETHPEVGLQLARFASADLDLAFEHLTSVGRQSARERVARLLLQLFMRHWPLWKDNGIEAMLLPLTQEHIGDATGLTAVHVNRVLRKLKQDGIVEFHYRRLRILDPDKLSDVAGIDPQRAKSWFRRRSPG